MDQETLLRNAKNKEKYKCKQLTQLAKHGQSP